jgi:hypothetical protein
MRKLILISAFVLASVSAQAGQGRGLVLAANDEPKAVEKVETAKLQEPAAVEPAKSDVKSDVKAGAARPVAKPQASKPAKKTHARHYEGDEAKARRIAAKYGIYW